MVKVQGELKRFEWRHAGPSVFGPPEIEYYCATAIYNGQIYAAQIPVLGAIHEDIPDAIEHMLRTAIWQAIKDNEHSS